MTETTSDDFKKGIKAAFDWMMMVSANNFHSNPELQKYRDSVNEILENCANDALHKLSPEDARVWKTGHEMYQQGFKDGQQSK